MVIAKALPVAGIKLLEERFELDVGGLLPGREELMERVRGAAAIVPDPTVRVDGALLDYAGPQLKVIANFAVGTDNIDIDACRERGIVVTNTPDVLTNATAELALALALAAARHIVPGDALVRGGEWRGWEADQLLGLELSGSTIGIYGLGRIGRRFAELARGLSKNLIYASRKAHPDVERELGLARCGPREILERADLVSLHMPLTGETHHLIDGEALAQMKDGAVLVNTGRGELVDTAALIDALKSGRLRAAGLDVYEGEPDVPPELRELDNVVLAPHIGSATEKARNAMAELVARNVIAALRGEEPVTRVA